MYFAPGPTRVLKLRWPAEPECVGEFAASMVEATREISQLELDHSPASITVVETVLFGLVDEGWTVDDIAETLFGFGCYVGEVIRGAVGGDWVARDPEGLVLVRDGELVDPVARTYAFFEHGADASLADYVAGVIGQPIERGVAVISPRDLPSSLLRVVGMRVATLLVAMQDTGGISARHILLRHTGDEVVDDPWDRDSVDEDRWRWMREPGVARALIRGPDADLAGFLTILTTLHAGAGPVLRCAIPTLPAYGDAPFQVFALQSDDALPDAARAEILAGIAAIDASFVTEQPPPRNVLRVEYLGPRVSRDPNYLYAIDHEGVFRTRIRALGDPRTERERVLALPFELDEQWLYFVDKHGEVARLPIYQVALCERWLEASDAERAAMRWSS